MGAAPSDTIWFGDGTFVGTVSGTSGQISLYRKRKVVFPNDDGDVWSHATVTTVTSTAE